MAEPGFWRPLGFDAAIVVAWLRRPGLMAAVRTGVPWVVSVADSDGVFGVRAFPLAVLRRMVAFHSRWVNKVRAAKHWCQLALGRYREHDREVLAAGDSADRITVTTPGARDNLGWFFASHARPDLAAKVAVVPYPVDDEFLTAGVSAARANRVVAIGRWDDPQKDAGLLAAGLGRAAAARPDTEFVVLGRGGERVFGGVGRRHPGVRYIGVRAQDEVAGLLRASRALVVSSRWESGPIVAFEAVCSGATVVGPAWVPACPWVSDGGRFGTVFARRSPAALAAALTAELAAWDTGARDPAATAAHWRPRFDPRAVCEALLPAGVGAC